MIARMRTALNLAGHKARRLYRCNIKKRTTLSFVENHRRGECTRCGECCKILFHCPFYVEDVGDGKGGCGVYESRPATCSMFPIHPKDLTNVPSTCGFYFETRQGERTYIGKE